MTFPLEIKGPEAIRERLRLDLSEARTSIAAAALDAAAQTELQARVAALAAEVEALPAEMPPGFRAIMPFSDLQARIYALQAPVTVPLRVTVYPLDLPAAPSIAIGGWDYTHLERTERDGGVVHQADFIAFLREYGVNTPWAGGLPTGAKIDERAA